MLPVMLDPAKLTIGLAGRGGLAARRLAWLRGLGATPLIYADDPESGFAHVAGEGLLPRLPDQCDLARLDILWIADLDPAAATALFERARSAKVIVNVEDVITQCDFHTPAVVKRGRLVIAAGTGGASPAVASVVRAKLEEAFPEDWGVALEDIAAARTRLREAGAGMDVLSADAKARLVKAKLL